MTEHVPVSTENGELRITLNRPEKNALTPAMYAVMTDALEQAASSEHVRVVLLTGSGDSYTAGNDIADFRQSAAGGGASGVPGSAIALFVSASVSLRR
jgi:enoyl-CoA hydratase/carnithine racemase